MPCFKDATFPPAITLSLCVYNGQRYHSGKPDCNSSMPYGEHSICLCIYSNARNVSRSIFYGIYLLKTPQWLRPAGGALLIRRQCSQLEIAPAITPIIYTPRL
ncbi:hypothetical protein CTA1_13151 [Colletotrichum tanaceti]|uniref:Uncharacterized protein n=1 Tax=Colletotrichum tanaceti TaxID=1306861 RepID=A0A4U6X316_9PEZI|nr:hypothetical protein CTA1_13151 [Colletotrichum tanaceti]